MYKPGVPDSAPVASNISPPDKDAALGTSKIRFIEEEEHTSAVVTNPLTKVANLVLDLILR